MHLLEQDMNNLLNFQEIERIIGKKKEEFLKKYVGDKCSLATLIIGFRVVESQPKRLENLQFLLEWINYYYEDMFDVLLVEQDDTPKISRDYFNKYSFVRYQFIFNPRDYNRGWAYNVAVRHFCSDSDVVVLMDTDVLTGRNFASLVRDCAIGKFDIISPYQNIYYSSDQEVAIIREKKSLNFLNNREAIKNPVTLTGGIVIFKKSLFMELNGFEQYIGYGGEDRALDVTIYNLVNKKRIYVAPVAYVHLWHPVDTDAKQNTKLIFKHLDDNYGCKWHKELQWSDFIHRMCNHSNRDKIIDNIAKKIISFGDLNLYKNDSLLINGVIDVPVKNKDIILPPNFSSLTSYILNEYYPNTTEPDDKLKILHNSFLGKRCFIIGNGPSLNKHDLSLMENEYTFAVNSFYYKTQETGFTPTFFVVEDSSVMKENLEEIKNYYAPFKFFPTLYKKLHPESQNTFFFTMNRGFYEKSSLNYCVPRFSTDASKEIFCGQSVTYINLQLAYYMGFSEVYLIGMDFDYVIPESHKRTGDVLLSDTDDPNHFHKDYFGKGKTWKDPKLERVASNYKMAKLAFESTNRKIYNATIGGKLEIFDRVDYSGLFSKKNIENSSISFRDANFLFRENRLSEALSMYIALVKKDESFALYQEAAIRCYLKMKSNKESINQNDVDYILKLMAL